MAATKSRPPSSVAWIWRMRDAFAAKGGVWIAIGLLVVLALGATRGIYTVNNGESAALLRFGRLVDDAITPGLRYRLPFGIDEVTKTRTGEVFRQEIEGDSARLLHLVTGDENLIDVAITVQFRITRLGDYLFSVEGAEEVLAQTIRAELVESAALFGVDDLLTSAKALVQQEVRQRAQERLRSYGVGATLVSVNLLSVDPPREAEAAFRDVIDARAESAQTVSRARAEQDRGLRLASGQSAQIYSAAEAETNRRQQAAQGAVGRFEDLLTQKRLSPGLTRADLYTRTMSTVLPRTRIIVLAPGEAPRIDVNLVEGRQP